MSVVQVRGSNVLAEQVVLVFDDDLRLDAQFCQGKQIVFILLVKLRLIF